MFSAGKTGGTEVARRGASVMHYTSKHRLWIALSGRTLKPLQQIGGVETLMLYGVIGFIIGNLSGVTLLCLLQINENKDGGMNYAGRSKGTESEEEG